jgi:hypothetical protein
MGCLWQEIGIIKADKTEYYYRFASFRTHYTKAVPMEHGLWLDLTFFCR